MIASLASFTGQYSPELVEKGRILFKDGQVGDAVLDKGTYHVAVTDGQKKRQVSVRLESPQVTDIFCTCGPAICPHVMAAFFKLQQGLDIKEEAYVPPVIEKPTPVNTVNRKDDIVDDIVSKKANAVKPVAPAPKKEKKSAPQYSELGNRINDLVYVSRAPGSKNGELEELGEYTSLKDLSAARLEKKALADMSGYDLHPIFNGSKRLLGAAIREYEAGNYEAVLAVAKAILTSILDFGNLSNSGQECCDASIALLDELYNGDKTTAEFRDKVFNWVIKAWGNEAYADYASDLIGIIGTDPETDAHREIIKRKLKAKAEDDEADDLWGNEKDIMLALLLEDGDEEAAAAWKERYVLHFRKQMIADALERKDYATAKQLAAEGLETRDREECWKTLHEIAIAENDPVGVRNYHIHQFLASGDMSVFETIRVSCNDEEWKATLPVLIRDLEQQSYMKTHVLSEVLLREDLHDELFAHIRKQYVDVDRVIAMAPALLGKNEDRVLDILREQLTAYANKSKQRENAKIYAEKLRQVRAMRGGKKMVSQMLKDLFTQYPGWNVLKSEMGKYI